MFRICIKWNEGRQKLWNITDLKLVDDNGFNQNEEIEEMGVALRSWSMEFLYWVNWQLTLTHSGQMQSQICLFCPGYFQKPKQKNSFVQIQRLWVNWLVWRRALEASCALSSQSHLGSSSQVGWFGLGGTVVKCHRCGGYILKKKMECWGKSRLGGTSGTGSQSHLGSSSHIELVASLN